MNSFLSEEELKELGLGSYGKNVKISRKASFYSPESINLGDEVRIDDFCILSGKITIGSFVHIAAFSALYAGDTGISIGDFVNLSSRVTVYAQSDDYSGETLTGPMVSEEYKNMVKAPVIIEKHTIIGTTSVVLPGVTLSEGSSFGAMSFINRTSEPWSMNVGIPYKKIKDRSRNLLELEKKVLSEKDN